MNSEGLPVSDGADSKAIARAAAPLWRLLSRRTGVIAAFNAEGDGFAFYCVHSVAGDVTTFRDLAQQLGPEQRFYGIQVPKEKLNAAFATSVEAVARFHVEALVAFQPEGPLLLGGWSAGAIIALEMAQQLRAAGRDVPLLVALDAAPFNTGAGIKPWNPLYAWKLARNLPRWIRDDLLQDWSLRHFTRRVANKLVVVPRMAVSALRGERDLNGYAVQGFVNTTGWLGGQIAFSRALYNALRAYVAKPYGGRVLVYEARTQPLHHLLQVGAIWAKLAEQTETVLVDGTHVSIFREPHVGVLAAHLRARLAEVQQAEGAAIGPGGRSRTASCP
jgi:thioesterase domain-containing protein